MIQGFKDRKTGRLFAGLGVREFRGFSDQAVRRLAVLNSAETLQDLANLRSNRFEALSGDRKNQFSMRINRQWRICFRWKEDGPFDVEIVDCH